MRIRGIVEGVALALVVLLLAACGGPALKRLTAQTFPPKPASEPLEVYGGKVTSGCLEIAYLNSISLPEKDAAAKARQLEDLKQRARRLGADAVQDVMLLERRVKGFIVDEMTPFRSWKQDTYSLYFLRGTAIKYLDDASGEGAREARRPQTD